MRFKNRLHRHARRHRHTIRETWTINKLYRDPDNGVLFGVCAGIADYFDLNIVGVRVVTGLACFFFFPMPVFAYLALAFFLPKKPEEAFENPDAEDFWKDVRTEPSKTFSSLRSRYRDLEKRLRGVEAYATSREFRLAREIDDLEK